MNGAGYSQCANLAVSGGRVGRCRAKRVAGCFRWSRGGPACARAPLVLHLLPLLSGAIHSKILETRHRSFQLAECSSRDSDYSSPSPFCALGPDATTSYPLLSLPDEGVDIYIYTYIHIYTYIYIHLYIYIYT